MKKKIFLFAFVLFMGFVAILSNNTDPIALASGQDEFIIRAYGDSISAGYNLEDYPNYILDASDSNKSAICKDSYAEVFSRPYLENFGGKVQGFAVSGDKTGDLIEILEQYNNDTASDLEEFNTTDIITLSIGANNILQPTLDNLQNFLTDAMTEEEFQALLNEGVENFKNDYSKILESFSGKKIVVMTIYNPFKYLSLNDVTIDSSLASAESTIRSTLSQYETKLQTMITMSIDSLQIINEEIRNNANKDVYVVDIYNLFETFSIDEYLQYINSDMSQVTITELDITSILSEIKTQCDPHPTKLGHEIIANEHLNSFKYFYLSSAGNFEDLKEGTDKIQLNLTTFETNAFNFKFYKKSGNTSEYVSSTTSNNIKIDASLINGQGVLYAEVYENSNLIYTTNEIEYKVSLNTYSISATQSLAGVKDGISKFSIKIDTTAEGDFNFKLFKQIYNDITLLKESSSKEIELDYNNIVGKGNLYVEVYKDNNLLSTTNSINFDIILNSFTISCDDTLVGAVLDSTETVGIKFSAKDFTNYSFKIYKKADDTQQLLKEGTGQTFKINSTDLAGNGIIYAEVYKNSTKLYTTNSLNYSISLNQFSLESQDLTGVMSGDNVLTINVVAGKTEGYSYSLYQVVDSQTKLIATQNKTNFEITAQDLKGSGQLYVEVFKNSLKICTTESLDYDITIGTFRISDLDLTEVMCGEDLVYVKVKGVEITNPSYKLFKEVDGTITELASNILGEFEIKANDLGDEGHLFIEVFSNEHKIATTNSVDYSFSFVTTSKQGESDKTGDMILMIALALVAVTIVIGAILLIIRMSKRLKLY